MLAQHVKIFAGDGPGRPIGSKLLLADSDIFDQRFLVLRVPAEPSREVTGFDGSFTLVVAGQLAFCLANAIAHLSKHFGRGQRGG